jgi:hypothetical protein
MLRGQARTLATVMAVAAAATGVAACGSSSSSGGSTAAAGGSGGSSASSATASSSPVTLLKQAFSSSQSVKSGKVNVQIVIKPTGSSIITTPITIGISGPYEQAQKGQTPESDISISFSGLGKHFNFGFITTKDAGYITLEGAAYKLPAADFKQIAKSIASGSSTGGLPGLGAIGIDPTKWLTNPQIVGTQEIDGTETEHLSSSLDIPHVIGDIDTLMSKESSKLHLPAGTDHISSATAAKIAAAIKNPTIDMWVGKSDTILRRLQIGATVPVSGKTSTELGGLTSAAFTISVDISDVNQPQTIAAPANAQSYQALRSKLQSLLAGIGGLGSLGGSIGGAASSGGGTASVPSSSSGSTKQLNKYSKCLNNAGGDITKMQKCQSLLNG